MSHNVTVTRTTTTVTTTSALLLNTGYLKTTSGILKLLQLVLGCIIIGLVGHYFEYHRLIPHFYTPELFFLLVATTCLITTTCLLVSCLLSISTATIIAKTMFELVYHGIAFCLYLASSIYLLTKTSPYNSRDSSISAMIAAGVSMLLTPESVLYLCATIYFLVAVVSRNTGYAVAEYGYNNKMFAAALGGINTGLYFASAFLAFRIYRRS